MSLIDSLPRVRSFRIPRADALVQPGQSHKFAFNLDKAVLFDPLSTLRI